MILRIPALGGALLIGTLVAGLAGAQLPAPPDGGESIGQQYTGRSYSPYAERDFADQVFLGRHAPPHVVLDGCRRLRQPPGAGRRLSLRAGRAGDCFWRPDRAPLATACFLVVADHSDNMGFFPDLLDGKASIIADHPDPKSGPRTGTTVIHGGQRR